MTSIESNRQPVRSTTQMARPPAQSPTSKTGMLDAEVCFVSASHRLSGTLLTPTDEPAAIALLISGSGPIDRDSNTEQFPIDVMRQVAEHLAGAGVGSYRYDKRGIGASEGEYLATGFYDNVADAEAALALLRRDPKRTQSVVVVGHSEGAVIAAELAASDPTIAGVVLLAGAAQTGEDILRWQSQQITRSMPAPQRALVRFLQDRRIRKLKASTGDVSRPFFAKTNARWFREFLVHDPTRSLAEITVPVLAITGGKDIQVDPGDVGRIGEFVTGPFTGANPTDLTHLLRTDQGPPSIRTYKGQAKRPVDPNLLANTARWIQGLAPTGPNQERSMHDELTLGVHLLRRGFGDDHTVSTQPGGVTSCFDSLPSLVLYSASPFQLTDLRVR